MADKAHVETDKRLAGMERHISAIYSRANKELTEKADAYLKRFEIQDKAKRKLVDDGKMSEEEYKKWRINKIMTGNHWTAMKEQTAQSLLHANMIAQDYINGCLPEIYALNYNAASSGISDVIKGYSFELVDASTVKNLATSDETLLPYKHVDGKKDVRWNTKKVNAEVLQGIIQGESIPEIAKRLRTATEMNKDSAIRNARTTITSAENKGRMDSYERAKKMGIKMKKQWLAALDSRTRDAHRELDGVEQDVDKPFKSLLGDIMYPGDPSARPANVYNCRCTLVSNIIGFEKNTVFTPQSYAEELIGKRYSPNISDFTNVNDYWDAKKAWQGKETKYVDDMSESGKFVAKTAWGGDKNEKISRIEGTIADLNDEYPAQMHGNLEHATRLEQLTVCDYSRAWEFLPQGSLDRRLTDDAAAQVFIVQEDGKSRVVVAFNRSSLMGTMEETIKNRKRAIDTGDVLSAIGYSPESTAIHEWGHVMSEHINNAMIYQDETAVSYWNWYESLSKEEIRQGISDYATANRGEFEAECFAEMHMPNPRPLAVKFKEYLDEVIKKGY